MRRLVVSDLRDAAAGERSFDRADYCAFAIGPRSEHDVVTLVVGGQRYTLRPGEVLPVAATAREPVLVESIRFFDAYDAEIYAFESRWEAQVYGTPQRAPYVTDETGTTGNGSDNDLIAIPFAGRRHAALSMENTGANSAAVTVYGRRYYGTGASDFHEHELIAQFTIAASGVAGKHAGGTDSEEALDELIVRGQTDAATTTVRCAVDAFGELGGN